MKEALKNGFVPGIIATLCCLGPLFLIMLGLISASTALSFTAYSRYFIPIGVAVFLLMIIYSVKKRKEIICSGCTDKRQEYQRIVIFVASSVIVAAVTYLIVYYKVLPALAPFVFDNFYRR